MWRLIQIHTNLRTKRVQIIVKVMSNFWIKKLAILKDLNLEIWRQSAVENLIVSTIKTKQRHLIYKAIRLKLEQMSRPISYNSNYINKARIKTTLTNRTSLLKDPIHNYPWWIKIVMRVNNKRVTRLSWCKKNSKMWGWIRIVTKWNEFWELKKPESLKSTNCWNKHLITSQQWNKI